MMLGSHDVTDLLYAWNEGNSQALNQLMDLLYDELHREARRCFEREGEGHTLQPTALVHEVYLRLAAEKKVRWQNRGHFFGAAARLMRRILVDQARHRNAAKRGGGVAPMALDHALGVAGQPQVDLLALDDALARLAATDVRKGHIVELRFFAGLTIPQTAKVLGIGPATVNREWRTARAWLLHELRSDPRG